MFYMNAGVFAVVQMLSANRPTIRGVHDSDVLVEVIPY